jgi:ADP-heptose:LPS heptosyltransferase
VIAAPAAPPAPVWRHLLATVGGERGARAPIVVPAALREDAERLLRDTGWDGLSRTIVVHPGAGGAAKRWPSEGFVDLLAEVTGTIVVHQGPADQDAVEAFLARTQRPVLRLVDPPLPTLAGLLAEAAAYLGNDSGISHLAATVGTTSVVLFTDAMLPWAPWSPTAQCVPVTTSRVLDAERALAGAALRAIL